MNQRTCKYRVLYFFVVRKYNAVNKKFRKLMETYEIDYYYSGNSNEINCNPADDNS